MRCNNCGTQVIPESTRPLHAGFSNVGVLYCDRHSATLTFSTFDKRYTALVGEKHPWTLSADEQATVEFALRNCRCGGTFRFGSRPKCPHCKSDLDVDLPPIYYFIVGEHVDGETEDVWASRR